MCISQLRWEDVATVIKDYFIIKTQQAESVSERALNPAQGLKLSRTEGAARGKAGSGPNFPRYVAKHIFIGCLQCSSNSTVHRPVTCA